MNHTRLILEHSQHVLHPGEAVQGAVGCVPRGYARRTYVDGLVDLVMGPLIGGAVGGALKGALTTGAAKVSDSVTLHRRRREAGRDKVPTEAEQFPTGQLFVVLTDRRLLALEMQVGLRTVRPGRLLAEYPLDRGSAQKWRVRPRLLIDRLEFEFSDGSTVLLGAGIAQRRSLRAFATALGRVPGKEQVHAAVQEPP